MKISVFLVIILLVIFWYGIIPFAGAVYNRYKWRLFRQRFDKLRLRPLLDYNIYSRLEKEEKTFRFIGDLESITDRNTLWIRGENLTIPVSLAGAQAYLLPIHKGEDTPNNIDPGEELPERINWNKITTLTEGAKVYVGGSLVYQDDRRIFITTKEEPLTVIFFDGPDRSLTSRAISAGRNRNEYWNYITPYSLAIGALCLILIAVSYLHRPAFRLTVITAVVAVFIPLFPIIPPGVLLTAIHRRLLWQARKFMAYSDLARLPLRYFSKNTQLSDIKPSVKDVPDIQVSAEQAEENSPYYPDKQLSLLPDGETYAIFRRESLPKITEADKLPPIIPELAIPPNKSCYVFGALHEGEELPHEPGDPFATYGILPEKPDILSKRYATVSHILEIIAWLLLLLGIGANLYLAYLIPTLI